MRRADARGGGAPCRGPWDLDHPRDFDAEDWWYRCRFAACPTPAPPRLRFEGLATVADVWLNGGTSCTRRACSSRTPSTSRACFGDDNELVLRFHALAPLLAARRPRPRWRTQPGRASGASLVPDVAARPHAGVVSAGRPGWSLAADSDRDVAAADRAGDVRAELDGERRGLVRVTSPLATCPSGAINVDGTLTVGDVGAP